MFDPSELSRGRVAEFSDGAGNVQELDEVDKPIGHYVRIYLDDARWTAVTASGNRVEWDGQRQAGTGLMIKPPSVGDIVYFERHDAHRETSVGAPWVPEDHFMESWAVATSDKYRIMDENDIELWQGTFSQTVGQFPGHTVSLPRTFEDGMRLEEYVRFNPDDRSDRSMAWQVCDDEESVWLQMVQAQSSLAAT